MDLDQTILDEVLRWGRDIAGFSASHAIDGLTCVQGYVNGVMSEGRWVPGIGVDDRKKLRLYALDISWLLWMDDVFDKRDGGMLVDLESIIRAIDGPPTTPEATGLYYLRKSFESLAANEVDYKFWLDTAAATVTAWSTEERLTRKELTMSYSEYLENSVDGFAVPHIVATANLIYGYNMASRRTDVTIRRIIRNISISSRLLNDLVSIEKERREGCLANACILMERLISSEQSRKFIEDELASYMRMLNTDIAVLGEQDPFSILARVLSETHRLFHTTPRERYAACSTQITGGS